MFPKWNTTLESRGAYQKGTADEKDSQKTSLHEATLQVAFSAMLAARDAARRNRERGVSAGMNVLGVVQDEDRALMENVDSKARARCQPQRSPRFTRAYVVGVPEHSRGTVHGRQCGTTCAKCSQTYQ